MRSLSKSWVLKRACSAGALACWRSSRLAMALFLEVAADSTVSAGALPGAFCARPPPENDTHSAAPPDASSLPRARLVPLDVHCGVSQPLLRPPLQRASHKSFHRMVPWTYEHLWPFLSCPQRLHFCDALGRTGTADAWCTELVVSPVSSTSADATNCCTTDAETRAEMHPPKAKENPPQHLLHHHAWNACHLHLYGVAIHNSLLQE